MVVKTTNLGCMTASQKSMEEMFRPSGALLEAQTALGRAIERYAVEPTGHKPATIDLLVRLSLASDRTLRAVDICRSLLMSAGYVSRLVDHAESEGLVERVADPNDRRAQLITLTEAGAAIIDAFAPAATDVLDQTIYDELSDDEVATLVDLLGRVTTSTYAYLDGAGSA